MSEIKYIGIQGAEEAWLIAWMQFPNTECINDRDLQKELWVTIRDQHCSRLVAEQLMKSADPEAIRKDVQLVLISKDDYCSLY